MYLENKKEEIQQNAWLAYHIALLQRMKKLPSFDKFINNKEKVSVEQAKQDYLELKNIFENK